VTTGGSGKTIACTVCHGDDLNGVGSVPAIAARSPSYIARQLYDFQQGARHGDMADLMKKVAANLNNDDMVNITAYLASLPAPATVAYTTANR
jgi:cytochrome c553